MKKIYKSILTLSIGLVSLGAVAQTQDSVLTRQVMLERDYNPTLNEATKINTEPNIYTPKIQLGASTKYIDNAPQLNIAATKLGEVASGDIMTSIPFSKQRFYLNFGAGSHGMLDGTIGVRAVDSKNDKLDIFATHASMSGDVKNIHSKWLFDKSKAKFSDTKVNLKYRHTFEPSVLSIGAAYQSMGYNYYGSPLVDQDPTNPSSVESILDYFDLTSKQKVDMISFNAGLKSREESDGLLKYEVNLGYTNFTSKYGFLPSIDKGPRGGIFQGDVNFYTELGAGDIGIAGNFLNQSFSGKDKYELEPKTFEGFTNLTANPYYKIEGLNWNLVVGANVSYVLDDKNKFVVAPNVKAQFHINDVNTVYASVTGGVNNNTSVDILQENRYASPLARVAYSKTPFDVEAGFRSGVVPNLEFELFAGYKQVKGDHLFGGLTFMDMTNAMGQVWSNVSTPLYSDVSTGHFGGQIKTKLISKTTLTAKAIAYFYDVKGTIKAWGKPSFTADINADIKPMDKLTLSLSYTLMAGRKGYGALVTYQRANDIPETIPETFISVKDNISMKAISELNVRAEYEIIKQISVFARINNLLDQRYEYQLGYGTIGMNVLGGVSVKL